MPVECCTEGSCINIILVRMMLPFTLLTGLATLLFWLIFLPRVVIFDVNNATLATFDFETDSEFNYDIAINFTVRNPAKHVEAYYYAMEGSLFYDGLWLSNTEGPSLYQRQQSIKDFGPLVFKGYYDMIPGSEQKAKYEKQTADGGVYDIKVRLTARATFKFFGFLKTWPWSVRIICDLILPLHDKSSMKFQRSKCRLKRK